MEAVMMASGSENEAYLQCLTLFLELRKKLRLSCESISGGLCMIIYHVLFEWRMSLVVLNSFTTAATLT